METYIYMYFRENPPKSLEQLSEKTLIKASHASNEVMNTHRVLVLFSPYDKN